MSGVSIKLLATLAFSTFFFSAAASNAAEIKAVWTDKEAKLQDLELIRAINDKDIRVISEGGIKTLSTAMTVIVNNGRGVFCKAKIDGALKDFDVVKFDGMEVSTDEQARLDITELRFSKEATKLVVWCVSKGDISIQELKENTDIILSTKGKDGKFSIVNQDTINQEHQQSRTRQQSLRIKSFDKLVESGQINSKQELVSALIDGGKIVSFDDAIELVYSGRIKMACSVARMSAKAKVGDTYKLKALIPMGADRENGIGNMQYQYEDQEGRQLVFTCSMRLSARVSSLFSTFQGVLEF